jgi:hypothetical protein
MPELATLNCNQSTILIELPNLRYLNGKNYVFRLNLNICGLLKKDENSDNDHCSICLEVDDNIFVTKCGHKYHIVCLEKWLEKNNTCPYCRVILTTHSYTT